MFNDKEIKVFYKFIYIIFLMVFISLTAFFQFILATNKNVNAKWQHEIGKDVSDGMKMYREGTVIFELKNMKNEDLYLYKNGKCVGNFGSGRVGLYVYDGDVLELICYDIKKSMKVFVKTKSKNITSHELGETVIVFNKKITPAGVINIS